MADVDNLEFSKFKSFFCQAISIATLFCFPVRNFTEIGQGQKTIRTVQWPSSAIFNFKNFYIRSSGCHRVPNLLLCNKCHQNRMIFRRYMAISRFSRWRISAILNFMGPTMGSLKSQCTTLSVVNRDHSSKLLSFWENRHCTDFGNRQTDRQTNRWVKEPSLSRAAP